MDRGVDINSPPKKHLETLYNPPMNQQLLIGIVIGLVIGGVGGYFVGAMPKDSVTITETETAVNPFEDVSTNPLEDVTTNPYENVRTNPFE